MQLVGAPVHHILRVDEFVSPVRDHLGFFENEFQGCRLSLCHSNGLKCHRQQVTSRLVRRLSIPYRFSIARAFGGNEKTEEAAQGHFLAIPKDGNDAYHLGFFGEEVPNLGAIPQGA